MHIPTAHPKIRRAVRRGFIAGYRGSSELPGCAESSSPKAGPDRGHWFRCGWQDGKRLRVLNPHGAREHLKACT